MNEPQRAAFYLPQLAIKSFGGFLEPSFDALVKAGTKYQSRHDCEEEVALRHPQFGHYEFTEVANIYFAGAGGGVGPSTRRYDLIDCLIWLLSDKSSWLPKEIRNALFLGLTDWGVWGWRQEESSRSDFKSNAATGSLAHALNRAVDKVPIKLTKKIQQDIKTRIKHSKSILHLPETVEELVEIFYKKKIIESWIRSKHEIEKRRNRKNS